MIRKVIEWIHAEITFFDLEDFVLLCMAIGAWLMLLMFSAVFFLWFFHPYFFH
jgi:hypothetical protein